jgi:hypothetical protein
MHLNAPRCQVRRRAGFDAEVEGCDRETLLSDCRHDIRARCGDLTCERGAAHLRSRQHAFQQRIPGLAGEVSGEDADAHGTTLAQVSGQRSRVDTADADDSRLDQLILKRAPRAPAGGPNGRVAHDVTGDPDAGRLVVLIIDAGVADVRRGHHHDLAVIARVGQRLLVTAHACREHGFTNGLTNRSIGGAHKCAAILQNQDRGLTVPEHGFTWHCAGRVRWFLVQGLLSGHGGACQASSPFRTVGTPCRTVA